MTSVSRPVKTRFAPSPTGDLHIGGVRTALFSWLFARRHGGSFVLRIEDTDRERSSQASVDVILEGMQWLGLEADEGPFYQTQRMDRYQQVIQKLLDAGQAYRCTCTPERLEKLRAEQMAAKQKPRYDGCCRDRQLGEDCGQPFVIRFRRPDDVGSVQVEDRVKGRVTFSNDELDDLIIQRSNGTPTYHLTVVVDDHDMGITHVIRGDDHLNNTPRQIQLLQAIGADVPVYAHLPMILGPDGKRLSKRHGATNVLQYRAQGYLPSAMLNYLVRLGWSHGDQEQFTVDEMMHLFDLDAIHHAASAINPDKLDWLNQKHMQALPPVELAAAFTQALHAQGIDGGEVAAERLQAIAALQVDRAKTLHEMAEKSLYFFTDAYPHDEKAIKKHLKAAIAPALQAFIDALNALPAWQREALHDTLKTVCTEHDLKLGKLAQPVRVALTGGTVSPPIDATLELLGRERSLQRLAQALAGMRSD